MSMQSVHKVSLVHRITSSIFFLAAGLSATMLANTANSQDLSASISTTEGYVGSPIVLEIRISNVENDYDLPEAFKIEGCDVQRSTPSQSSQITIFNGRRSESRSIGVQYFITPRRAGDFEIPEFMINVDGKKTRIQAQAFSAKKSETGDLLFVEVAGAQDSVFVGEPLELILKIWLKPYAKEVADRQIKFSEGQMWQTLSERSSWGKFESRMKEMAANRQRPGGKTVQRTNDAGEQDTYYLYEITTTIYPDRPGNIDASDLQIVANFPTKIGRQRDPFGSLLGPRVGASSLMRQMMDDDFFGSSPFRRGLSVTESRPITADARVDSTKVLPIPAEGRPDNYRGAVGKYNIAVQARPTHVEAGAPITLQIGISGDGPMELVQAPPLHETGSLTDGFKVSDQSLAGFVQGQSKVFVTSIRPRRAGLSEIPPIPFSYFDPEKREYVTVASQPIPIIVTESESLSLDAIVSNQEQGQLPGPVPSSKTEASKSATPDLTNEFSETGLFTSAQPAGIGSWIYFIVVPPLVWLGILITRILSSMSTLANGLRSPRWVAERAIQSSVSKADAENAIVKYVARKTGDDVTNSAQAMGALRTRGLSPLANIGESLLAKFAPSPTAKEKDVTGRQKLIGFIGELETAFQAANRSEIGTPRRNRALSSRTKVTGISMAIALTSAAFNSSALNSSAFADQANVLSKQQPESVTVENPSSAAESAIEPRSKLTEGQTLSLFDDANLLYQKASALATDSPLEARDLFERSAQKYRMLVDVQPNSASIHMNLGNAYLQSNKLGLALASYHRVGRLLPSNKQAAQNIAFIKQRLASQQTDAQKKQAGGDNTESWSKNLQRANSWLIRACGAYWVQLLAVLASIVFWAMAILRTLGIRFAFIRLAIVPFLVLVASISSLLVHEPSLQKPWGIVMADTLTLRSGDGDEFEPMETIEYAEGLDVQVIGQRGDWLRVELPQGKTGWTKQSSIATIVPW